MKTPPIEESTKRKMKQRENSGWNDKRPEQWGLRTLNLGFVPGVFSKSSEGDPRRTQGDLKAVMGNGLIVSSHNFQPKGHKCAKWHMLLPPEMHINENLYCTTFIYNSVKFRSVAQSCLTLCDPTACSTPGLPVRHQLPELTQAHVHWDGDAIQPSHPVVPFSPRLQSFLVSGSFPMSQFFPSGGQSTGVSDPILSLGLSPLN